MSELMRIGLDNPILNGRLKTPRDTPRPEVSARSRPSAKYFNQSLDSQLKLRQKKQAGEVSLAPVWAKPLSAAKPPEVLSPAVMASAPSHVARNDQRVTDASFAQ